MALEVGGKMKFLDKLGLAIFSIIVLILSILFCMMFFGFIDTSVISLAIETIIGLQNGIYITTGILVILILLAIKCLFFPSWEKKSEQDDSEGILLQNDNGKLLITKGTIKNLVSGVVEEFKDIQEAETEVFIDDNNEVYVNLTINVYRGTVIKDISTKLQNKIKESVKKTTDLVINQINIKVIDVEKIEERTEEKEDGKKEKDKTSEK